MADYEPTEAETIITATAAARGWSQEDSIRLLCEFIEDQELTDDLFGFLSSRVLIGTEPRAGTEDCDECGEPIPDTEPDMVNAHHAESCSLYPQPDDRDYTQRMEDAERAGLRIHHYPKQ